MKNVANYLIRWLNRFCNNRVHIVGISVDGLYLELSDGKKLDYLTHYRWEHDVHYCYPKITVETFLPPKKV